EGYLVAEHRFATLLPLGDLVEAGERLEEARRIAEARPEATAPVTLAIDAAQLAWARGNSETVIPEVAMAFDLAVDVVEDAWSRDGFLLWAARSAGVAAEAARAGNADPAAAIALGERVRAVVEQTPRFAALAGGIEAELTAVDGRPDFAKFAAF